jgi:hypothetical protein
MAILNVFAIIIAGLMVGSELAIAAFAHPTLVRLSDTVSFANCECSGTCRRNGRPTFCSLLNCGIEN